MQKTEIHWSPNDRNQLAEIGAEIIIHTFDRPLSGESGKCVLGGTNKRTTSLNYPLHEKNYIKVCYIMFPNGKSSKKKPFILVLCMVAITRISICVCYWTTKWKNYF